MIMASMRNWLNGGPLEGGKTSGQQEDKPDMKIAQGSVTNGKTTEDKTEQDKKTSPSDRVVVVHCKAGKGRSGTISCSYLISECGWKPEDALARFTERRMRPRFGEGVSIPSQVRWISYVDRWTRGGKRYVDREIEIVEIHMWGLRHGVKVSVEGYIDEGKKIKVFHTFSKDERIVVEGDAPGSGGMMDFVTDIARGVTSPPPGDANDEAAEKTGVDENQNEDEDDDSKSRGRLGNRASGIFRSLSKRSSQSRSSNKSNTKVNGSGSSKSLNKLITPPTPSKSKTIAVSDTTPAIASSSSVTITAEPDAPQSQSQSALPLLLHPTTAFASSSEPGGRAVIFKPTEPIRLPGSDVNIAIERRNRAGAVGAMAAMTMVTAVAHVWFNAYFEGGGPENPEGRPDASGVFEIEWDALDGIKGSSRKGTRACDRFSVVWRAVGAEEEKPTPGEVVIHEPSDGSPIPQMQAANWKGVSDQDPDMRKGLGLRAEGPDSGSVSKASSIKDEDVGDDTKAGKSTAGEVSDDDSMKGVKSSGPQGEEALDESHSKGGLFSRIGAKARKKDQEQEAQINEVADATAQKGFIIE
jgi:hypothetical protein